MTSRERVIATINHQVPDRVPIDLGGTQVTTFSAKAYQNLRDYLGLPKKPCELTELFMFVAKVEDDVRKKLGIDTACLTFPVDTNGCRTDKLQPFTGNDGAETLIGASNKWDYLEDGSVVMYPKGDKSVPASTRMLPGGHFFDNILDRLPDWDEDDLDARRDWKEDFQPIRDWAARKLEEDSKHLYEDTDFGIIGQFPCAFLGDGAVISASSVKHPTGIRKMDDFLAATLMYPEYILESFQMQTENALKNLEIYHEAVGDRIQAILISTADYGSQIGPLIAPATFREMYKPFYKQMNDWVHKNTNWKTMYHCCGNIMEFIDDYIDMGADILNPIQLSAKGMDAHVLKEKYGDKIVFWGGGADAQGCLSFGGPEDVKKQVTERLDIFSPGGGYVFNPVHNIMADTKMENIMAMFEAVHAYNDAHMKK